MSTLLDSPRWHLAAQALVEGCVDLTDDDTRVDLLIAVCDGLGDDLYPAFLHVLARVGQHGDHAARAAVAGALVHAIRTGRLPGGPRGAWGASTAFGDRSGFGHRRRLDPLEYLCAWHAQEESGDAIPSAAFQSAARALMELIDAHPDARALYCEKLLADVDDPIGGALTRRTRAALRVLAVEWAGGASAIDACARFVAVLVDADGSDAGRAGWLGRLSGC